MTPARQQFCYEYSAFISKSQQRSLRSVTVRFVRDLSVPICATKAMRYEEAGWAIGSLHPMRGHGGKISEDGAVFCCLRVPVCGLTRVVAWSRKYRTIDKAAQVGIQVELEFRKESYRSKASFLDLEDMPVYDPSDEEQHIFSRKRILFCV